MNILYRCTVTKDTAIIQLIRHVLSSEEAAGADGLVVERAQSLRCELAVKIMHDTEWLLQSNNDHRDLQERAFIGVKEA